MSNEQFRVNNTINKHTIDRFKVVADKDMWRVGFSYLLTYL